MDLAQRLAVSYYREIAVIDENHKVYLVQHQENKRVYVKKILDVYNLDTYKTLSTTNICGIPKIYECYLQDDQLVVIEEYISGVSLQDRLENEELCFTDSLNYIYDLCQILEKLHSLDPPIIHRDIKPSNIIISSYNRAVLLDFNAAKRFSAQTKEDTILLGTKGYAAPEQYGFGSSTPRTDIYSLGIVLKEMLSVCKEYPPSLNDIVLKCTQLDPKERYTNVSELKDEIAAILKNGRPAKRILCKYLPPGFRTRSPLKMLIASTGYLFIFWLALNLEVKNKYGGILWLERITCLCMMLSIVFGSCNYLGIQDWLPYCHHKNIVIRCIAIAVLDFVMVAALLLALILIEGILLSR